MAQHLEVFCGGDGVKAGEGGKGSKGYKDHKQKNRYNGASRGELVWGNCLGGPSG